MGGVQVVDLQLPEAGDREARDVLLGTQVGPVEAQTFESRALAEVLQPSHGGRRQNLMAWIAPNGADGIAPRKSKHGR